MDTTATIVRPRLRVVGGVCAGVADHLGVPVAVVRTVAVLLALCGGAGILLYAWLWATTPVAEAAREPRMRESLTSPAGSRTSGAAGEPGGGPRAEQLRRAPVTEILLGLALIGAGGALVASRLGVEVPLAVVIPGIVVLAGVALAWRQFADLRAGGTASGPTLVVRSLGALVLVATGILLFFITGETPNVWTVVVAAVSVLLGVGLVALPWVVRLARDLGAERAAHERAAERAEIAAHLHDSVLQTLALIQQKAGAQSEAARLARAQERELRDWLFDTAPADDRDLASELRRLAAVIEEDHAVRFELVTVGASVPAPESLLAAGREAMLNAARHAGGDVSIFLEVGRERIELIVTDRGPGVNLDAIPADRLGVRESIIGRLKRAGGTAAIGPGRGGTGTEVRLTLPVAATAASAQGAGPLAPEAAVPAGPAPTEPASSAPADPARPAGSDSPEPASSGAERENGAP
ncbi:ATP-binding protein [Herbiconiux ginsengi]|uniref:Phage shock protein C (PspC) family protein n=1 Tax=Herbiconiux ginsengi TaxID=381665 RepID=A0A1H3KT39_9MICO|nr:ATP-binding protein [Herbiconiux ginsengi]SDY55176.1 phage shock protein C (PspC) family protein [Herbiconiux ginsengi]